MKTLILTSLEQLCGILPPPTNEAHFALPTHICLIFIWSSNEWIFFYGTIITFISHFFCFTILCPWLSIFMTILKSNCWEILTHVSNNQCCFASLDNIVVVYSFEIDSNRHFLFYFSPFNNKLLGTYIFMGTLICKLQIIS